MRLWFSSVLFDVDGTLIDSNAAHATAWVQALRDHGHRAEPDQVRPLIGMGTDKLLPTIANVDAESAEGRRMGARKKEIFDKLLPGLRATRGARALLEYLRDRGVDVVVATSAGEDEMDALLRQAGLDDMIDRRVSKSEVADSKPDPDIVLAALAKARSEPASTVMVGDTPYDVDAATRAGVASIALRCGGYWVDRKLRGALHIFDDPAELLERWRQSAAPMHEPA
jgi:HAD superfamily hydrolase (TIGR01509 family)